MSAHFHPPADMLMDYASGALREASSLLVATHLALCAECRKEVAKCEAIGGRLLEQAEEIAVSDTCRAKVMALLDEQQTTAIPAYDPFICNVLPAPLRSYVGCGIGKIEWKKVSATVDRLDLDKCHCSKAKARLLRVKAGAALPEHTHRGNEYVVVLAGSYRDGEQLYRRGDFAFSDNTVTHAPVAGPAEDCVCLIASEGSIRLTGLVGLLLGLFTTF